MMYQEVNEWLDDVYHIKEKQIKKFVKWIQSIENFDEQFDNTTSIEKEFDKMVLKLAEVTQWLKKAEKFNE